MYETKANHGVNSIPKPDSVTITMPWDDFVSVFALIAGSTQSSISLTLARSTTETKRPQEDMGGNTDLHPLYRALKPLYVGDVN